MSVGIRVNPVYICGKIYVVRDLWNMLNEW